MSFDPALALARLQEQLGSSVHSDEATRQRYRRDYWAWSQWREIQGEALPLPACVVTPRSVDEVARLLVTCSELKLPVVPYGMGSGVCGAILTGEQSVVLDLGSLTRVRRIDDYDLVAEFDAGVRGSDAESALGERRLTLGHYPQSLGISSVGGWVATGSAGQFSTGYGNIEDLVLALEVVLPTGEILRGKSLPRTLCGGDWKQLFVGSEGKLGVITGVTLSVRRAAEQRLARAYYCPSMQAGLEAQRLVLQSGWLPTVLRQYDAVEVKRMFPSFQRDECALLLLVHEGPKVSLSSQIDGMEQVLLQTGCTPAPSEAAEHWLATRNQVSGFQKYLEAGLLVDTVEVTASWSSVHAVYEAARTALASLPRVWNGSAHSSHAYRSGLNLYFSFAVQPESKAQAQEAYTCCFGAIVEAALAHGGSMVHHHGVGRVRQPWLEAELGSEPLELLRRVQRMLDPAGIMNPGATV